MTNFSGFKAPFANSSVRQWARLLSEIQSDEHSIAAGLVRKEEFIDVLDLQVEVTK